MLATVKWPFWDAFLYWVDWKRGDSGTPYRRHSAPCWPGVGLYNLCLFSYPFTRSHPVYTAALQIRSPRGELASWSAYVWNGSGLDSKNATSEEKIRKWPTQSPFLEAGALAGDQSYALRPNFSGASIWESPQIPISKNVGLEAKLIKTAKLKLRKCLFFF